MFFCYINCIEPPIDEYNCLLNFITKTNLFSLFPKTNATHYDFCSSSVRCDETTGTIKDLTISNGFSNVYNGQSILPTDFQCLPNFNRIYLQNLNISKELVFHVFPQTVNEASYVYGEYSCSPIDQEFPEIQLFFFSCQFISGTTIKMSYIMKQKFFYFEGSFVYFENDVVSTHNISITTIRLFSLNYPDFSNFQNLVTIQIVFNQDFVLSSIQNFSTIKTKTFDVNHDISISYPFYVTKNNFTKTLSMYARFEKPNSMIDLSSYTFTGLTFTSVGDKFNLNGEIPIIPPPGCDFLIGFGNFNVFPNFTLFTGGFSSLFSNFPIDLPRYSGKNKILSLGNNNLTGTIDESWCNVNLYIANNKLTGEIPSCFTCYFSDPTSFSFFAGNKFTNYNQSIGCSEFAPRFELVDISTKTFIVTGINIGFNPNNWLLNSVGIPYNSEPISTGYGYNVSYITSNIPNPKYFNILFVYPKPSQTIYFPIGDQLPNPTAIKITSNQLIIKGELFSSYMGYSNQSVQFEETSTNCTIKDGDFFNITCEFAPSSISTLTYPTIIKIKNDNLIRRVIVNPSIGQLNQVACPNNCDDLSNSICDLSQGICISCDIDCGIFGECNFITKTCDCDSNHQGPDCSLPFIQCPTGLNSLICSSADYNMCNNQTGVCTCSPNQQGKDCSLPFKQCPVGFDSLICSGGNSNCNNQTGICYCDIKFTNDDCSKPNQYISSVSPSNTNGGEASFFGWFGDTHTNPSLLIGNQQCQPITYNSSSEIRCIASPGNGVYDITFSQNDIVYQLRNGYSYLEIFKNCPNDCTNSNQGNCNTSNGECNCINNYYSFDCSLKRNNNTGGNNGGNPSIDPSTGGTNITDNQVNFQIYFKNLFEIDFNGNIVNQYSLQSNWTLNKTKDSQSNAIYKLTQTIQQSCEIITFIEEISTSKQFSFAGSTFTLDAGSVKLTISISNYNYKSSLNTLQLQLISSVDNENEESDCNNKQVSTNETNTSSFKYIKISKDNRVLQGRFINQVLSDGRSTYLSIDITNDGNSVIAKLNLPHFINQSIIDPDFSVLLETDFKSECDTENSRKWLIPVAVIVPVVGICFIAAIVYIIYKKQFIEKPLKIKLAAIRKMN
ncbi:hypothetical protein ACTFIZ_001631 [Dictyostelium cf. discoideum]